VASGYPWTRPLSAGLAEHAFRRDESSNRFKAIAINRQFSPAPDPEPGFARLADSVCDMRVNATEVRTFLGPCENRLLTSVITAAPLLSPNFPLADCGGGPKPVEPFAWEAVHSRFAACESLVKAVAEYARPVFAPGRPLVESLRELQHRINGEFEYKPQSTEIGVPLQEVLEKRHGVCQDFAHVMIGALRSAGLAARYVSGYLRSGKDVQGAEASHAWVSAYVPGVGWVDFDPTNDVMPTDGHVTVGWGRDYGDVTPLKGVALGGGGQTVDVEVHVAPLAN